MYGICSVSISLRIGERRQRAASFLSVNLALISPHHREEGSVPGEGEESALNMATRSRKAKGGGGSAAASPTNLTTTKIANGTSKGESVDGGKDGTGGGEGKSRASSSSLALDLLQSGLKDWLIILSLIFGGCCSNAWALELSTTQLPSSGTLITFAQFLTTTLSCLPTNLYIPDGKVLPRLKPRVVPLSRWAVQVLLYLTVSLLNNTAFAYDIPMSVHIVFRSGGLVINMILGWTVQKRKYTLQQVLSVLLVTTGVISSTLYSNTSSESQEDGVGSTPAGISNYLVGVILLTSALVLTGLMGLWQEKTFEIYGNQNWRESLFYSHLLSLPMFALRGGNLRREIRLANATEKVWVGLDTRELTGLGAKLEGWSGLEKLSSFVLGSMRLGFDPSLLKSSSGGNLPSAGWESASPVGWMGFGVPCFYPPLLLNVLTQLLCINGVNRLTSKVSSLSVTLVLVVRKALSLVISVLVIQGGKGGDNLGLWFGATSVLLGTVGYSLASSKSNSKKSRKDE
ncbi:UAA-domain-containing protein [Violaceomyces palustris]|uniref:UAA-domain-containing protein n=1 Tax=Violaceomyces palustris TaxID=1673888 RepID=A0ACD0NUN4_9BASI|nr:UAA-domain-containing protein [Violaceomyces palustris]